MSQQRITKWRGITISLLACAALVAHGGLALGAERSAEQGAEARIENQGDEEGEQEAAELEAPTDGEPAPPRRNRPLDQGPAPDFTQVAQAERGGFDPQIAAASAQELMRRAVVNSTGDLLGRVDDVVMDVRTGTFHLVVATGGIWGIGQRRAAVPLQQMHMLEDGSLQLRSTITQQQLEQMALFDRHGYESVDHELSIAAIVSLEEDEQLADTAAPDA